VLIWRHPLFLTPYNGVKNMYLKGMRYVIFTSMMPSKPSNDVETKPTQLETYFFGGSSSTSRHYLTTRSRHVHDSRERVVNLSGTRWITRIHNAYSVRKRHKTNPKCWSSKHSRGDSDGKVDNAPSSYALLSGSAYSLAFCWTISLSPPTAGDSSSLERVRMLVD
jgi:hypothetical protein